MLKMRLQRTGRKNDASFRLIVTDSRRGPKSGKHIDLLGSYNPKMNHIQIDADKAKKWIAQGVQVSDTVHNLLVSQKIVEGKKINVLPRKSPIINEEKLKAEAEAKEAKEAKIAAEVEEAPAEPTKESEDIKSSDEKSSDTDVKGEEPTPEETPIEESATGVVEEKTEEKPAENATEESKEKSEEVTEEKEEKKAA